MANFDLVGLQILIVEDEYLVARSLRRLLELSGATVIGPAASVEKALMLANTSDRIDGALLDINLRERSVFPLADVLIARGVPIVFTTGYDTTNVPQSYAHVSILQKPFDPDEIPRALFPS
jgi:DNA-binding LytR/AlgR family response regulator